MEQEEENIRVLIACLVIYRENFKKNPNQSYVRTNLIAKHELCTRTYNWAKEKLKGIRGEFDQETFNHYSYKLDSVYSEVSELIKSKLMANLDLGLALKVVDKFSGDRKYDRISEDLPQQKTDAKIAPES